MSTQQPRGGGATRGGSTRGGVTSTSYHRGSSPTPQRPHMPPAAATPAQALAFYQSQIHQLQLQQRARGGARGGGRGGRLPTTTSSQRDHKRHRQALGDDDDDDDMSSSSRRGDEDDQYEEGQTEETVDDDVHETPAPRHVSHTYGEEEMIPDDPSASVSRSASRPNLRAGAAHPRGTYADPDPNVETFRSTSLSSSSSLSRAQPVVASSGGCRCGVEKKQRDMRPPRGANDWIIPAWCETYCTARCRCKASGGVCGNGCGCHGAFIASASCNDDDDDESFESYQRPRINIVQHIVVNNNDTKEQIESTLYNIIRAAHSVALPATAIDEPTPSSAQQQHRRTTSAATARPQRQQPRQQKQPDEDPAVILESLTAIPPPRTAAASAPHQPATPSRTHPISSRITTSATTTPPHPPINDEATRSGEQAHDGDGPSEE